jgi:hypothetical protein
VSELDFSSMSPQEVIRFATKKPKRKKEKKSRVGKMGIVRLRGRDLEKLRRECGKPCPPKQ